MTRAHLSLGVFVLLLAVAAGCGGGTRAALNATVFPGDRVVNGRRLGNLAQSYENTYGCTEADTITITGVAPAIYHVEGCAHIADFQLFCRPNYSGYGSRERCDWIAFDDLTARASADFGGCDPAAIDVQVVGPTARTATGCGFRATYTAQCGAAATCPWILASRIEAAPGGAVVGGGGAYTY